MIAIPHIYGVPSLRKYSSVSITPITKIVACNVGREAVATFPAHTVSPTIEERTDKIRS